MKQCAPSAVRQSHLYASQNNPFTAETAIIQEPNLEKKNFQMALLGIETQCDFAPDLYRDGLIWSKLECSGGFIEMDFTL